MELRGIEPLSENISAELSPGADDYGAPKRISPSRRKPPRGSGQVASLCMVRSKLCALTDAADRRPDPGPQPKYYPRHPGIRSCMILSQGAPLMAFADTAERMEMRLKTNGFDNLATLRYGMGIDFSGEPEEFRQMAETSLKKQEEDNGRLISEICEKLGR